MRVDARDGSVNGRETHWLELERASARVVGVGSGHWASPKALLRVPVPRCSGSYVVLAKASMIIPRARSVP